MTKFMIFMYNQKPIIIEVAQENARMEYKAPEKLGGEALFEITSYPTQAQFRASEIQGWVRLPSEEKEE